MSNPATQPADTTPRTGWHQLELEITGRCPIACRHCYADSGPTSGHGTMTEADWRHVIDQAADLGFRSLQLIGGEPTSSPLFADLLSYALERGPSVEVYSNLHLMREQWWDLVTHERCTLATSYYSDEPAQHDEVTRRRGSHARTRANIAEALRRGIPIRVGVIEVLEGQRVEEAAAELRRLGVTHISLDRMRGAGRSAPDATDLCGHCGRGRAAVSPDGEVWPCVLGRAESAGNVRSEPLEAILTGPRMAAIVERIPPPHRACKPGSDGNDCKPAETIACPPKYS